jgi:hypothetical protein
VHTYIRRIYINTYMNAYIHNVYIHTHTHTHTHMHAHIHTCIHKRIHMCIIHTHTHTQRSLRAHWARRRTLRRCQVSSSTSSADGAPASPGFGQEEEEDALQSLEHIHTSAPRPENGVKARMSIRHVCAVRIQGVARGMLVRMRLGRWHLVRRAAVHAANAATSENVAPKMAKLAVDRVRGSCGGGYLAVDRKQGSCGGGYLAVDRERESFPPWVVRPPHARAVKGTRGVWEVVEELRSELEVERIARRKQDEALRVLWSEVFFFLRVFPLVLHRKAHTG